jgi:hypothetical protein
LVFVEEEGMEEESGEIGVREKGKRRRNKVKTREEEGEI